MKLFTVKSEGLAHYSYFLSDDKEAAVIDPMRDCEIYLQLAKKQCVKLCYILETHRHEDFIVGSRELHDLSGAQIGHSKQLDFKYGQLNLEDGETLNVGKLQIKTLHTPGHTNESLCYAVSNTENSPDPFMVFTGDTLFVGSVGRTDLQGKENSVTQSEKLYNSLHEKLLPLGDDVVIYPAHGAGSLCGSQISSQKISTIGYEKKTNPYLKLDKDGFIQRVTSQELLIPPYFRRMHEYNLTGAPPLHGLPKSKPLNVAEFEDAMDEVDSVVVDTRFPNAFAGGHISNSISIWLGGTAVHPGWVLDPMRRVLLVTEREADVNRVQKHFWRIGYDNLYAFLCGGISVWQEQGKPIEHLRALSASELYENKQKYVVLDVRTPREWTEDGYIEGAERVFFGHLQQQAESIERNSRIAVICSTGRRATIGASILKRKGFIDVSTVLGSMTAWKNLGYPIKKD